MGRTHRVAPQPGFPLDGAREWRSLYYHALYTPSSGSFALSFVVLGSELRALGVTSKDSATTLHCPRSENILIKDEGFIKKAKIPAGLNIVLLSLEVTNPHEVTGLSVFSVFC